MVAAQSGPYSHGGAWGQPSWSQCPVVRSYTGSAQHKPHSQYRHLTPYTSHLTLNVLSLATDRALNGEYEFDLLTNYESSNFVSQ